MPSHPGTHFRECCQGPNGGLVRFALCALPCKLCASCALCALCAVYAMRALYASCALYALVVLCACCVYEPHECLGRNRVPNVHCIPPVPCMPCYYYVPCVRIFLSVIVAVGSTSGHIFYSLKKPPVKYDKNHTAKRSKRAIFPHSTTREAITAS